MWCWSQIMRRYGFGKRRFWTISKSYHDTGKLKQHSWFSDQDTDWKTVVLSIMGLRLFSSVQTCSRVHPLLFVGKWSPFPQGAGHDTDHSLPSSTELRMKGAIPLVTSVTSWHAEKQLYLYWLDSHQKWLNKFMKIPQSKILWCS
jgi:hypothetical protein